MRSDSDGGAAIREAAASDCAAIADIYNHYITDTVVTFEEEVVPVAEIARRVEEVRSASFPWLVAEADERVVGYAYARPWHARSAYRFAAEITVYLAPTHVGRRIGSKLYGELFPILQARRIHTVLGGIALPNGASVALHEKFGLRKVAHYGEIGFKFDRWIDVGYWQRVFEAGEGSETLWR
jgi:phosphinothricin acetyltransferase